MSASGKFEFAIDRGGTFTDVFCVTPDGRERVLKLLSEDPNSYLDAPREGIRRILDQETSGQALDGSGKVRSSLIGSIRMGTTVATNALLEKTGAKTALLADVGLADALEIGTQARDDIFALDVGPPALVHRCVGEVACRVVPARPSHLCGEDVLGGRPVQGGTGELFYVLQELDEAAALAELQRLRATGATSLAIVLAHSYAVAEAELKLETLARRVGFEHVAMSHQASPMVRLVARGHTACADAYLTPVVRRYLDSFRAGFDADLGLLFMQSDGGLAPADAFRGARAVLSGPAGGVVGYAAVAYSGTPLIGFDMGGTSTDVSRYAGKLEHITESSTAGVPIQVPQLDIHTVAAGGGSILAFRDGLFYAGPESAGANPGPACYMKSGPAALTDANLLLGRLLPEHFPKEISAEAARARLQEITDRVNRFAAENGSEPKSVQEVALGFVSVANEAMCRAIRCITQARGHEPADHVLVCFGGAGGQHACSIARSLGIGRVFVPRLAGILSAYGLATADVVFDLQEAAAGPLSAATLPRHLERLRALEQRAAEELAARGFPAGRTRFEGFLHLRYEGTDCPIMVSGPDFEAEFTRQHRREFGFEMPDRAVLVDDVRVRAVGMSAAPQRKPLQPAEGAPKMLRRASVHWEAGPVDTPVFMLADLAPGHVIEGPALIQDALCTVLVEPACTASITPAGDLEVAVSTASSLKKTTELEPIRLSVLAHRFMSIAEQMGRALRRTAVSTNIKERLDFSCALFSPDGGLVSNAPHIPVHLGSMQEAVRYQIEALGEAIRPGDVLLSNSPMAGGSHLPDLTVITPVFMNSTRPVFFVASRGHHADIGGITPGSMPPNSTSLDQEGAVFDTFKLVDDNHFMEKELRAVLSASRNISDNVADLKAQIAANKRGTELLQELVQELGLDVVHAYMGYIQKHAEHSVRQVLKEAATRLKRTVLRAEDCMDDGSPVKLEVRINPEDGSAECDFTGSGHQVWGNCNAPRAITLSALIYCLRCMIGRDTPLNQGCLTPVKVIIPKGSILDPAPGAAVVGGNVLTSQRVVDVVFKAFEICAASQGCMNNITFGGAGWGMYETIAGGSGAGPTWHGRSAVHTHMTNTRITDVEVLERRFPVFVRQFKIRKGSGGRGKHTGGDGVVRELQFRAPVTLSVLTERRAIAPYGLDGGEAAQKGVNLLHRKGQPTISLGPKAGIDLAPGDSFELRSPGGGGYGRQI